MVSDVIVKAGVVATERLGRSATTMGVCGALAVSLCMSPSLGCIPIPAYADDGHTAPTTRLILEGEASDERPIIASVADTLSDAQDVVLDVVSPDSDFASDEESLSEDAVEPVSSDESLKLTESNSVSSASVTSQVSSTYVAPIPEKDIWYVGPYGVDFGATEAPADGSVSLWRDNFYVCHSWAPGGKRIASKPDYVVVDGVEWEYDDAILVTRDTDPYWAIDWGAAAGGPVFQTCSGPYYMLVRYHKA